MRIPSLEHHTQQAAAKVERKARWSGAAASAVAIEPELHWLLQVQCSEELN